jgi:Family of unknown function (DUF6998)
MRNQRRLLSLVNDIYAICDQLNKMYPDRKFTPDGHLLGSIGDVQAAEVLNLELVPQSTKGHDAISSGKWKVEIKTASRGSIAFQAAGGNARYLVVMDPRTGKPLWIGSYPLALGKALTAQKNGQRTLALSALQRLPQETIK